MQNLRTFRKLSILISQGNLGEEKRNKGKKGKRTQLIILLNQQQYH